MRTIAWSTASSSNGKITQWSRWHIVYNTDAETVTLCGSAVPMKAKWVTGGNDSRIKGGHCAACKKANKERYPKP